MNELTEQERETLDKLNDFNLKHCDIKNDTQSLWNVCWGYLNKKFTMNLIHQPNAEIIKILKSINKEAPKVDIIEEEQVYDGYTEVAMAPLF